MMQWRRMAYRLAGPGIFLWLGFFAYAAHADVVSVAVASNFLAPVKRLAQEFERSSGHQLRVSAGSTGKLYAQIVNGAPFDVFLAANATEPERLEQAGVALAGSRFTYARGRVVLWSADAQRIHDNGPALLAAGGLRRIAIANPRTAPYGAAALAVLEKLGVRARIEPLLVQGEDIGQAFHFTVSGNTDAGFIAYAQLRDPAHPIAGSAWIIPEELYPPIRQQAVLLVRARDKPAARAFLTFLRGPRAARVIEQFGYGQESGAAPATGSPPLSRPAP
jgi:molybdate transport system substrate-binding protein